MTYFKIEKNYILKFCEIVAATNSPLTTSKILKICNDYSIKYNVPLPFEDLDDGRKKGTNKHTILYENIMKFNSRQQREIIEEILNYPSIANLPAVEALRKEYYERYGFNVEESLPNDKHEFDDKLAQFPSAYKQYQSAIKGIANKDSLRHIADDLRLCLELFLRAIFNNEKTLEKQIVCFKTFFKSKKSEEEINALTSRFHNFYKLEDDKVKHEDTITLSDLKYLLGETRYFIQLFLC